MQAATKEYVDNVAQGLTTKDAVRVFSTGNLSVTASSVTGTDGVAYTRLTQMGAASMLQIDGISLMSGDRLLLNGQSNAAYNGIYVVQNAGGPMANWIIDRALDANKSSELPQGSYVLVATGVAYANTSWVMNQANISMAVAGAGSNIKWAQFGGAGANVLAGFNMAVSGNTVHLGSDGAGNLSGSIALRGNNNIIAGMTSVTGSMGQLQIKQSGSVQFQDTATITFMNGATGTLYSGASLNLASGASMKFGVEVATAEDLEKLVNGTTISTGDALHSHSLAQLAVRQPLAKAAIAQTGNFILTLDAGYMYGASDFRVPAAGQTSWANSDLEVYLNGQLLEPGTDGTSMPVFAFTEGSRAVEVLGSVSGDHVYVRYYAKAQ